MSTVVAFVLAFLVVIFLVVIHELGHFFAAKFFGIKVEEFGVFFPPRIFAIKRGETEYSLNWIPLGGFVKIFGEQPNQDEPARLPQDEERSFAHKNRGIQAAVLVAGIVCNLIFAWLILSLGYMIGLPTATQHKGFGIVSNPQVIVASVYPKSPAATVGVKAGDVITALETGKGQSADISTADSVSSFIAAHQDESLAISVKRDTQELHFITRAEDGLVTGKKILGIEMADFGILKLNPILALAQGGIFFWDLTKLSLAGMASLIGGAFVGHADLSNVAGPVGILSMGALAAQQGVAQLIFFTAIISLSLGIMNLLPIPGLDGGRLFITAIEAVRRKTLNPQLVTRITVISMALLIALAVVISWHDIVIRLPH